MLELPENAIDLGHGTYYTRTVDKDDKWVGIIEYHHPDDSGLTWCSGWVPFNVASEYIANPANGWTVESYKPLTLSPSLLCMGCGHHGFIREGKWIPV